MKKKWTIGVGDRVEEVLPLGETLFLGALFGGGLRFKHGQPYMEYYSGFG